MKEKENDFYFLLHTPLHFSIALYDVKKGFKENQKEWNRKKKKKERRKMKKEGMRDFEK